MPIAEEIPRLRWFKDRFIRFWPKLAITLIDLDARFLPKAGEILVVGSGRLGKEKQSIINIDIRAFEGITVVCDAQDLPFISEKFDAVVCHQVLEHVPDADRAVAEMYRVLKSGGVLIATVPFYFPFHASPFDYRRWTVPGLRVTFSAFNEMATGMYIGPLSAILVGIQHFIGMLFPTFFLSYLVKGVLGYILFPLRYFDYLISLMPNAIHLAASVYYVGRKMQN